MKARYLRWYSNRPMTNAARLVTGEQCATIRLEGMCPEGLIYTPLPSLDHPLLSLEQCIENRARELLAAHDKICVLWSAGLDSTAVAAALLTYKGAHHTIFVSNDAVSVEPIYSDMAKKLVEMGAVFIEVSRKNSQQLVNDGVFFVNGSMSDLMTLHDEWIEILGHDIESTRKLSAKEMLQLRNNMTSADAEICLHHLAPVIDCMPVHMPRTGVNILAWIGFISLWDYDVYYMPFVIGVHPKDCVAFFNSNDFQRWAMQDSTNKLVASNLPSKTKLKNITNKLLQSDFPLNKNYTIDLPGTLPGYLELSETNFKVIWEDLTYIT